MTKRVERLVDLAEKLILIKADWHRKIVNTLLNLLRIRHDSEYEQGLDVLVKSAREMLKDPSLEDAADILLNEAEIAGEFPKLTIPEADNLEEYFKSLLFRLPGSLSACLAAEFNAEVSDYWNVNDFPDFRSKSFALSRSIANADDPSKEEEFALSGGRQVSHTELFELIRSHYVRSGHEILEGINDFSIRAKKGNRYVIVVVTEGHKILVTVNVLEM